MHNKVMLIILDGYGDSDKIEGNAVKSANTPYIDSLFEKYPHCTLKTNGKDVGLPEGIMGNSEVGHLNIGAGRIVYQLNTLIDHKIETGEFFENEALISAIAHAKEHHSQIHLFGLLSDGGVHSSLGHLDALLELFTRHRFDRVFYHAFMDGRDTLPNSGVHFMKQYVAKTEQYGLGKVASVSGRYYAMDRDNRWERVQKAYQALVCGIGKYDTDPVNAISKSYAEGITDEFILPTIICENNAPIATISDNDAIVFFNFRSDRPREITKAFIYDDFAEFPVQKIANLKYITMTEYDINFEKYVSVAFRNQKLDNILGQVIADNGMTQLRLAETEKYAHVTFFFNGGVEQPFENEDRILIPSPKVASYDLQPEMSAFLVIETAEKVLKEKSYDYITINFANCDMVGHTGVFPAVVKAVETVDQCLSRVIPLALDKGYDVILTADHGNAEQMLDDDGNVMTAHSMNKVPLVLIRSSELGARSETSSGDVPVAKNISLCDGKLGDIAPTILHLLNLKVPSEMTGINLVRSSEFGVRSADSYDT